MPRPGADAAVTLSVFDRLIDADPRSSSEVPLTRAQSVRTLRDAVRRGKLVSGDKSHPEQSSGYIVLAMGKMGAYEMNFSSDIDLMIFFNPDVAKLMPNLEPVGFYVRLTRDLVKLLQERTTDGYVFRVDLRLRPDPSSTQIAI